MNNLKKIVDEIESTYINYRTSSKEIRKIYNEHIELIILEAPKSEQYNLCDYWERLKG